jgi:hypothetical protein
LETLDPRTVLFTLVSALMIATVGMVVLAAYRSRLDTARIRRRVLIAASSQAKDKEQWIQNLTFSCVKCSATFSTREELLEHYDETRHDQYSRF